MIFIFGINISLFLSIILTLKKGKNPADKVLLFWLLVITIHQWLFYLDYSGQISKYGFLAGVIIPFPLLHGPFLFTYTSLLIKPLTSKNRHYWMHFLPFFLMHLYLLNFYRLPVLDKIFVLENKGIGYEAFVKINLMLILASGLGYILWSLRDIKKYQTNIKQQFSNISKIDLKWLQNLIYGLLFIWIVVIFGQETHTFLAVTLFVLLIGVFGIKQGRIFSNQISLNTGRNSTLVKEKANKEGKTITKQYQNSGLNEERRFSIKMHLTRLMDEEKIFLDPELSLSILATKLKTQPNYISQYINEELDLNFHDYINSKRVNEFKHRIITSKYKHYKLIEVAYDCGFNSKSSFNRIFKKANGMTPSAYLKMVNQKEAP
ncbi:AraC family transcriptional regulator, partial [Cytophagales bacterium RKSG123]|nr:AraC family transcriptional regulator [Xanthovirga aplysinae]